MASRIQERAIQRPTLFRGGLRWCEARPGNAGPSASSLETLVAVAPPRHLQPVNPSQCPLRDTRLTIPASHYLPRNIRLTKFHA